MITTIKDIKRILLAIASLFSSAANALPCTLAIHDVNVVPMDVARILKHQTIAIEGDRIRSITAGFRTQPHCRRQIEGRGLYAFPGLNDMHVHVESAMFDQAFGKPTERFDFGQILFPYLSYGVTGIRVMSGASDILAFRKSHRGAVPAMLVASPMLSGAPPILPEPITKLLTTPGAAVRAVNGYAGAGYDFIKIRENLRAEVLAAVIQTARSRGLDVDGHLPTAVKDPFATGQRGFAHVDQLSLEVYDKTFTIPQIVHRLQECRCYVTTTLTVEQSVAAQLRDYDALAARPEAAYVHPQLRHLLWDRTRNPYLAERQDPAFFDALLQIDRDIVLALHRSGIPLLAGTDAMIPMIIPGTSLHDELDLLIGSGLRPFEALTAATRTPGLIFPRFKDVGTLGPGKRANILLVSLNPLRDIRTLREPRAVIINGQYLSRPEIDRRMMKIARGYETR